MLVYAVGFAIGFVLFSALSRVIWYVSIKSVGSCVPIICASFTVRLKISTPSLPTSSNTRSFIGSIIIGESSTTRFRGATSKHPVFTFSARA